MSILEEPVHEARAQEWRTAFARALQQQKERAKEIFASRRESFLALQTELSLRLAELADELARQQAEALEQGISLGSEQAAVEAKQAELKRQGEVLAAQYTQWEEAQANGRAGQQGLLAQLQQKFEDLERCHAEIEKAQRQLEIQRAECSSRESATEKSLAEIGPRQAALEEQSRQLAQLQVALAEDRARFDKDCQELKSREQATQRQRRSIARQLQARKTELAAELDALRKEASATPGQDFPLQQRCAELQGKCERLREEASELNQQREDLQERLSAAQQQLAQRQGEWTQAQKHADESLARLKQLDSQQGDIGREREQLKAERDRLSAELNQIRSESHGEKGAASAELKRLRDENKQLEEWLREAEAKAKSALAASTATGADGSSQDLTDLQRRLELATEDCRELKTKNSDLQDELAKARQSGTKSGTSSPASSGSQGMDWEAQKQRLMAQLESDFDESVPEQKADRLTIEDAVRLTEDALAAKDLEVKDIRREVEELRSLLEDQSSSIGQVAVGAAAFASLVDKDEVIRQERENLQKMQEAMREQLKKAEIDISLERAKIARDRSELEEQLLVLQREQAQQAAADPASGGDRGKKPVRGRWLSRLGLKDGE
jgi:chromosome segregation ATPase